MTPRYTVKNKDLTLVEVAPVAWKKLEGGRLFLDFGNAAFGTLALPTSQTPEPLVVHLGEALSNDLCIDKSPKGTIRYIRIEQSGPQNAATTRLIIPSDPRNTGPGAIEMPPEIGEVYPFRYAEIEQAQHIDPASVKQICVHYPFDDNASAFTSSNPTLNAVWNLCKHSIKATSFCGVYVDGDRERIPYEGDAYINQLCHYGVDSEYTMGRFTHEYLLQYPTWPTEWQMHSVLMAWADYLYTGDNQSLVEFYDLLCAKTLIELSRDDGLISTEAPPCTREFEQTLNLHHSRYVFTHGLRDLVDWPPGSFTEGGQGERDNHEMLPVNTVVNAFHYRATVLMSRVAHTLGHKQDAIKFKAHADLVYTSFNHVFFDDDRCVYVDGEGSHHASLHSNMFALAFDLVPAEHVAGVVAYIKSRGMACSVYGAQYLLEALYRQGVSTYAMNLMTAEHDRSWWHMIKSGSTITWEAWDHKYKNNLDWNHAWGAVPANIIPRFVLGVRPLEPGFSKVLIQPQIGPLEHVSGKIPTPKGSISVSVSASNGQLADILFDIPAGIKTRLELPVQEGKSPTVVLDGSIVAAQHSGNSLYLEFDNAGSHRVEIS